MKKIILSILAAFVLLFGAYDDPGTDYDNATVGEYTEESALDALSIVNDILRFLKDGRVDQFINEGNYISLVKDSENGGGGSSGSGTTTTVEKLLSMTLNVTRETNTTITTNPPMKIKLWFDIEDGPNNQLMRIIGYFNVENGVDDEYPLGKLRFDFKGFGVNGDGTTNASAWVLKGAMQLDKATGTDAMDGRADVKFMVQTSEDNGTTWETPQILNMTYDVSIDSNGDGVVDGNDTQGNGVAYTMAEDHSGDGQSSNVPYELAFSNSAYKIQELNASTALADRTDPADNSTVKAYALSGTPVCKSKIDFTKKVYSYGLFDSTTGSKIALNAGFPIKKSNGVHGYIGYWGLWSENDSIADGDSVSRDDGVAGNYTVFQTHGKLIKHTKSSVKMSTIADSKLYFNTWKGSDQSTMGNYIIHWDSSGNGSFVLDGKESCSSNGCETNTTTGATIFTGNAGTDLNVSDWSNAWSQTLQAEIPIRNGFDNDTNVSYYAQKVIMPDANKTFVNYGYEIINPDMNLSSDANYVSEAINVDDNNSVVGNVYIYSSANGVLLDHNRSNKPVIVPSDTNWSISSASSHSYWEWGARMGPLLESNSSAVTSGKYNGSNFWQVDQNESIYYSWETGNHAWNKSSGLKDGNGSIVEFDSPIELSYTHTTANDFNGDAAHNGEFFTLHYDGNNLGLPWEYNATTGWMPVISIKSGTTVDDSNSSQYVIKALGIGAIPEIVSCAGVSVVLNPTKDVNNSFVPVSWDNNSTLLEFNTTVVGNGGLISTTKPTDANVSVIKGVLVE